MDDKKQRFIWGAYYPKIKEKPFKLAVYSCIAFFLVFLFFALVIPYENFAHTIFIWLMDFALIMFAALGLWAIIEKHKKNRGNKS